MFARLRTTTPKTARAFSTTPRASLARMSLIGRLAETPEATPTSTGRSVIRYALGVSSGPRDESGNRATSWFRIASFLEEGQAQRDVLMGLPKGTLMHVEADARMDNFTTGEGVQTTRLGLVQRE